MDIELAKTFLEIRQTGTFAKAAEHLHVTQTTVTTRIQMLEQQLGCTLFIRNRSGARLTEEGECFAPYAQQILNAWHSAKLLCPTTSSAASHKLSLGADSSLWNPVMVDWVVQIQSNSRYQVDCDIASTEELYDRIRRFQLHAAIVHSARYYPDVLIEQIAEEKLIHVEAVHNTKPDFYIEWGEEFDKQFNQCLPFNSQSAVRYSLGPMALKVMLKQGGNGYFRTRVVQHHLEAGLLRKIPSSPEFNYPIYLVSSKTVQFEGHEMAKQHLEDAIKESKAWMI